MTKYTYLSDIVYGGQLDALRALLLEQYERDGNHFTRISERSGVTERTLRRILFERQATVKFNVADRIVTLGLGKPEAWHAELAD